MNLIKKKAKTITKDKGEVISLDKEKSKALNGKSNRRLNLKNSVDRNTNAAWADIEKLRPITNVSVPSLENVKNAKEWVDNGSKL